MDLLEYLAELLGCTYLSDLKYLRLPPGEADKLSELDPDKCTLAQANEAAAYLTSIHTPFLSKEAALEAIKARLTGGAPESAAK